MKNEITAKRLAIALSNANMIPQELSDKSGVSKASLSQYLSGLHIPSNISSGKMASVLNVNPLWLMGFPVEMSPSKIAPIPLEDTKIPVIGRIATGNNQECKEEIVGEIEISSKTASNGSLFGFVNQGNSMEPDIHNNDLIIVSKDASALSGDIVLEIHDGSSDATCKRLQRYANGLALIPINPLYEPIRFTEEELNNKSVRIIGKVIEIRRKL